MYDGGSTEQRRCRINGRGPRPLHTSPRGAVRCARLVDANARLFLLRRRGPHRGRRGTSAGGCGRAGRLLEAVGPAELLAEPLHPAGRVDELLLAGKKRVALATDVDVDPRQRAARGERVAARTVGGAGLV